MHTYFLSLGSNFGNRAGYLRNATELLEKNNITVLKASSVYETQPMELKAQPDFLNQVMKVKTKLLPAELLKRTKKIEKQCGRKKTVRFGPRTLDVDILWWSGGEMKRKNLIVPHPRAAQRKFVLVPWAEIAGKNFMLHNKSLSGWLKLLDKHGDHQKVKRYEG